MADRSLLRDIGKFLDAIPEDRELLRGLAVEHLVELAEDVEGLALYLPHLYRARVGSSAFERAGAASAIGELRQDALEDVPLLVFESFVPLLLDSYVTVHKAAARALTSRFFPNRSASRRSDRFCCSSGTMGRKADMTASSPTASARSRGPPTPLDQAAAACGGS